MYGNVKWGCYLKLKQQILMSFPTGQKYDKNRRQATVI